MTLHQISVSPSLFSLLCETRPYAQSLINNPYSAFQVFLKNKFTCVVHHLALSVTLYMHVHLFAHKDRGIVTDSFQSLIHPGTADPSGLVFGKSFNLKVEKMKPSFLKFLVINFFEIRVLYVSHFFQFSCVYKRKINRLQ